jgi:membrane protease YdiL (CAAX protease family)
MAALTARAPGADPRARLARDWLLLPVAVLAGFAVFGAAGLFAQTLSVTLPEEMPDREWVVTCVFQLLMAALATGIMLAAGRGRLARFGFRRPRRFSALRLAGVVLGTEAVVAAAFVAFPQEGPGHFAADFSLFQIIVGILLIASTCEEVVSRGLVMGLLTPLGDRGVTVAGLRLSLPVITAALYFSTMHVPLLLMGIDPVLGVRILIATFLLGLIAGHYRETTGSLLPAVLAHMLANVFGMGIGELLEIL